MAAVEFRCPHRPWNTFEDKAKALLSAGERRTHAADHRVLWTEVRDRYAAARRRLYKVPARTRWERVVQRAPDGSEVETPTWAADVKCPECGDTIRVVTDQKQG